MHTLATQVETVTIYRQGARVTRLAELTQPAEGWPDQLQVTNLPLTLLDASLSLRLEFPEGGGGLVARELRVQIEPHSAPAAPREESEVLALRHEMTRLQCQLDRLDRDISHMQRLQPGNLMLRENHSAPSFPLRARRAVVELRQKTLSQWMPRRAQLHERLEELRFELGRAYQQSQRPPLELHKSVLVRLRARPQAQAPRLRLLLSYRTEGACWLPGYSMRFDRDYSLAELELRAMVCQTSGEDWNGARILVSTAEPEEWAELPVLSSRRLGRQQSNTHAGWRPPPPNTEELLADYDGVSPAPRPLPCDDFGPPPPYLSDSQLAALVLMGLAPEASAPIFQRLSQEQTELVVREIACLPHCGPDELRQAHQYVVGSGQDLESWSKQQPERLVQRLRALLTSCRPARKERPVAKSQVFQMLSGCRDMADLCSSSVGSSSASLECILSSPKAGSASRVLESMSPKQMALATKQAPSLARWELSTEQLAFELLYLPGAEERDRGRLRPLSPVEASLKGWTDRTTAREAREILERSLQEGRRALNRSLPTGYRRPGAVKGQDCLYGGESRVSVASDGEFHSIPLLRKQLPARLHWLVVPKVTLDVFRRVELECPGDLALPPGPVDLFVGSDYLACVELAAVASGESFLLDMGVETGVRVARQANFRELSAGMMGGLLHLRHDIQIEAHNYLNRQVQLQVREPLPQVSEGSDCKVRLETTWEALEGESGHFCWLSLPPGERAACNFNYLIEMSNRLELVGGNRLEK